MYFPSVAVIMMELKLLRSKIAVVATSILRNDSVVNILIIKIKNANKPTLMLFQTTLPPFYHKNSVISFKMIDKQRKAFMRFDSGIDLIKQNDFVFFKKQT